MPHYWYWKSERWHTVIPNVLFSGISFGTWKNDDSTPGQRKRELSYTLRLDNSFGPKTSFVEETQVCQSKPYRDKLFSKACIVVFYIFRFTTLAPSMGSHMLWTALPKILESLTLTTFTLPCDIVYVKWLRPLVSFGNLLTLYPFMHELKVISDSSMIIMSLNLLTRFREPFTVQQMTLSITVLLLSIYISRYPQISLHAIDNIWIYHATLHPLNKIDCFNPAFLISIIIVLRCATFPPPPAFARANSAKAAHSCELCMIEMFVEKTFSAICKIPTEDTW